MTSHKADFDAFFEASMESYDQFLENFDYVTKKDILEVKKRQMARERDQFQKAVSNMPMGNTGGYLKDMEAQSRKKFEPVKLNNDEFVNMLKQDMANHKMQHDDDDEAAFEEDMKALLQEEQQQHDEENEEIIVEEGNHVGFNALMDEDIDGIALPQDDNYVDDIDDLMVTVLDAQEKTTTKIIPF